MTDKSFNFNENQNFSMYNLCKISFNFMYMLINIFFLTFFIFQLFSKKFFITSSVHKTIYKITKNNLRKSVGCFYFLL